MSFAGPSRFTRWTRSLRVRLAVLYAIGAIAVLSSATSFLYWRMRSELRGVESDLLLERASALTKAQLQDLKDPGELDEQLRYTEAAGALFKVYARVLDDQGKVLRESPGMASLAPARAFPPPLGPGEGSPKRWRRAPHQIFLLLSFIQPAAQGLPPRGFQLALDISKEAALTAGLKRELAWVWMFGSLLSALIAAGVAHRSLKPLHDISASVESVTAGGLDIRLAAKEWPTELENLVLSLNSMLNRLDLSFRRLSDFSAELAHELRTPLHALRTQAEVTLARGRSTLEYQQALENALEEYGRLNKMVESLLFLAKADHAQTQLNIGRLDARTEIGKVTEYFEAMAAENNLELVCTGDAPIFADQSLLRRAVTNVLSNAVKFSPSGSAIRISIVQDGDKATVLSVTNSGEILRPEDIENLGTRFFRTRSAKDSSIEGFGLGMAIVKSILYLHDGALSVKSDALEGTTVTLVFPHFVT